MEKYQNILVVIDPTTNDHKSLKRALKIADKTSAKITALLTIYDLSYELTTMLSHTERDAMRTSMVEDKLFWLNDQVAELAGTDVNINCQVQWHNRPFESIVNAVIDNDFDLVIKGTHQHDKLKSVIFTPTDWHLLRKCPCPVLLVKDHSWPENGKILAAIHIGSDEKNHHDLNEKIITEAKNLASLLKADVKLINSYPGTPVNIAIEIPEFNAVEYHDTMLQHHQTAMTAIAEKFDITLKSTAVKEGLPEDVISEYAKEIDAELVVLGTIGRTGLSAAFIGNTAEHVIDQLNCDVLALKPSGYKSPLAQ